MMRIMKNSLTLPQMSLKCNPNFTKNIDVLVSKKVYKKVNKTIIHS